MRSARQRTICNRGIRSDLDSRSRLSSLIFLVFFFLTTMVRAQEPDLRKAQRSRKDVDLILVNGNVYTVNEKQPRAEAIAVRDQRIIFVGLNEDARKFRGDKTRIIDLGGKTVVPGFIDAHCHIFGIGEREMKLNLEGTNTREDFLARVKERVAQTERGKWITGRDYREYSIARVCHRRSRMERIRTFAVVVAGPRTFHRHHPVSSAWVAILLHVVPLSVL
jgi:hypothetical protein